MKRVRIRSYSSPYFPAFGLNTEVSLRIQFECGKIRTRITPNTDTFYAINNKQHQIHITHKGLLTFFPVHYLFINLFHYIFTFNIEADVLQVVFKIGTLKNFEKFTGKRPCWSHSLIMLQSLKTQVFFLWILRNTVLKILLKRVKL